MTLCFSAEPHGLATLYGDLVATNSAGEVCDLQGDACKPLRIENLVPIPYRPIVAQLRAPLRKIHPLGTQCAFACSGEGEKIVEYLTELGAYVTHISRVAKPSSDEDEHPLDVPCRLADQIGGVGVVGLEARQTGPEDFFVNAMSPGNRVVETTFGKVRFTGSGQALFQARLGTFSSSSFCKWLYGEKYILNLVDDFGHFLTNATFDESLACNERGKSAPDFGGIYETLTRDYLNGGWFVRGTTLHLFCEVNGVDGRQITAGQVPIFIYHDPISSYIIIGVLTVSGVEYETVPITDILQSFTKTFVSTRGIHRSVVHTRTDRGQGFLGEADTLAPWRPVETLFSDASQYLLTKTFLNDKIDWYRSTFD